MQLEEFETTDDIISVPPEEVVAEKKTLLSKLHSFEKTEETSFIKESSTEIQAVAKQSVAIIEPPKPPPKKVEVSEKLK